jgi:hypothetical protein
VRTCGSRCHALLSFLAGDVHRRLIGAGHRKGVQRDVRHAQDRRNSGTRRARQASVAAAALALAASGLLAALAAASTHPKGVVTRVVRAKRRLPPVTAPAPPLVSVDAAGAGSGSATPPAPSPAPAPPPVTPVVVSGGS